jgi:hypothetical protein
MIFKFTLSPFSLALHTLSQLIVVSLPLLSPDDSMMYIIISYLVKSKVDDGPQLSVLAEVRNT